MVQRIRTSILVLSTSVVTATALAGFAYRTATRMGSELRFLEPSRPPTVDEAMVACAIEYACCSTEKDDVIFVGASSCRCGVDPALIRGVRSYNLGGVISIGPDGILATAQAYLRHKRPKAIYLCLSPAMLDTEVDQYMRPLADRFLANYGDSGGVNAFAKRAVHFIKRGGLESLARASVDPRDRPLQGWPSKTYRTFKKQSLQNRGYWPLLGIHATDSASADGGPPLVVKEQWDVLVRQLAADCEAAKIRLILRFSPISEDLDRRRDLSIVKEWTHTLASVESIQIGRPLLLTYNNSFMWDAVHLNQAGVERFMQTVDTDVRTALSLPTNQL
jgi:hypothetical protein